MKQAREGVGCGPVERVRNAIRQGKECFVTSTKDGMSNGADPSEQSDVPVAGRKQAF